jgi:hypothetical protein
MADVLLEIEQARSAVINAAAALDAPRVQRERALSAASTRSAAPARWLRKKASRCTAASA